MASSMVSIRIPVSLVQELKEVSKKDHFLDLSEAVRSIIRQNWLREKDPTSYELKKIRKDISESLDKKGQVKALAELKKIMESIVNKDDGW